MNSYVYLVYQHQTTHNENINVVVRAFTNSKSAEQYAYKLNKEYAENVKLDKNGEYMYSLNESLENGEHFYNVVKMPLYLGV